MMTWLIPTLAAVAAGLFLLRWLLRERSDREAALLARVRTTALYRQLYPVLKRCEECSVEQIAIRPEMVSIRLYQPMNRVVRFHFVSQGLDVVDQPEALHALARAIAEDVPGLDEPAKFWFVRRKARRDVGGEEVWYEYNVQSDYRDATLRAHYDRPQSHEDPLL